MPPPPSHSCDPKYLVKMALNEGFAQCTQRRGVTPLVMLTILSLATRARRWKREEKREGFGEAKEWISSKDLYQDTQRNAFWLVLCSKKPPKSIPLGVLVYSLPFFLLKKPILHRKTRGARCLVCFRRFAPTPLDRVLLPSKSQACRYHSSTCRTPGTSPV